MATKSQGPRANGPVDAAGAANNPVELDDINSRPLLPIEEDLMQLARLGEIGAIQKLFDGGKFDAKYKDEQGITPLHVRASLPMQRFARLRD